MRNKYIVVCLIVFLFLTVSCPARSRQTPATTTLVGLANLLNNYKENHFGKLPRDWESFFSDQPMSPSTIFELKKYLDVQNRYQFLVFEKPFVIHGMDELFIVMANQSGGEGDQQEPGRFVIVETPRGEIQTRRYTETILKAVFQKNGYNLSDYTHILSSTQKYNTRNLPAEISKPQSASQNESKLLDNKSRDNQKNLNFKKIFSDWWLYFSAGLFFLIIGSLYIYFKCRSRLL